MKRLRYVMAMLVIPVFAAVACAHSIGVNFCNGKASESLTAHESAGASAVAQSHWNNFKIKNTDPNGHWNKGSLKKIVDNTGTAVKKMSVKVNTGPAHKLQFWVTGGATWGFMGPNLTLQTGMLWPRPQITVSGIPYAHYDVYVYADAGSGGGTGSVTISAVHGTKGHVAATRTYYYSYAWTNGHFVRAKSTTKSGAKGNYILFKGNTAHAITLNVNGTLGGAWTGVSGFQIVATK